MIENMEDWWQVEKREGLCDVIEFDKEKLGIYAEWLYGQGRSNACDAILWLIDNDRGIHASSNGENYWWFFCNSPELCTENKNALPERLTPFMEKRPGVTVGKYHDSPLSALKEFIKGWEACDNALPLST